MFFASLGFSNSPNPVRAAREASDMALASLEGNEPSFALIFATVGYEQQLLLDNLKECLGTESICGCSGVGVIADDVGDESNFSLSLLAIASDEVFFSQGFVPNIHENTKEAGEDLEEAFNDLHWDSVKGVLFFADGIHINLDSLLKELGSRVPEGVPIFGGAAGDNWQVKETFQYANSKVYTGGLSWVTITGAITLDWNLSHGCQPVGAVKTVTKAQGNKIYEIDGKPVYDVLGEYLDSSQAFSWNSPLVNIAFGFEAPRTFSQCDDPYEFLITHVAPTTEHAREGCVFIPRMVENGDKIWIMRRDQDRIAEGNVRMAKKLRERNEGKEPAFVLHIDCASRGRCCFGEKKKVELLDELRNIVGPRSPWIGFYSFGEICPVANVNCGHCYTAVVLALYLSRTKNKTNQNG